MLCQKLQVFFCLVEIFLGGERNLLALHDLGDVQIEEVAVENGLFCVSHYSET